MRVASCELKVTSYLQVESLKERVEIQKCEFKSTSSSSRVTSSNPRATSLTLLVASSNSQVRVKIYEFWVQIHNLRV